MQGILATVSTIAALLLVGTGVLSITFTLQGAAALNRSSAIESADEQVHEVTGAVSPEDIRFHEQLCRHGISTEALDALGGCSILSPPG
jgi:uncharacterized protein (DUF305 family)